MSKARLAILVSGNGSNLQAIAESIQDGQLKAEIALVISNNPEAYALERCKKLTIPAIIINSKKFSSREAFEKRLIEEIDSRQIEWICLAGFMRILTSTFVTHYKNRILNIHPSLLPAFPGLNAVKQAIEHGATETGVTIHFVDEGCDTGSIILQEKISILPGDTEESITARIHQLEHRLYPKAIGQLMHFYPKNVD